jgi:hypothetical protein
VTEISGGFQS